MEPTAFAVVPMTQYAVTRNGVRWWLTDDGADAYRHASALAAECRDERGLMPGDDRIQWPAIPAGVYIPPVPAPEAA